MPIKLQKIIDSDEYEYIKILEAYQLGLEEAGYKEKRVYEPEEYED